MSCEAVTKTGKQCSRKATINNRCTQHNKSVAPPGNKSAITITFGDQAENHVGMQKLGNPLTAGFSVGDLTNFQMVLEEENYTCELVDLVIRSGLPLEEKAAVLIVRGFLDRDSADAVFTEQKNLSWDNKAKMYGKVVNKTARHNLCYDVQAQEPNYDQGQGRIVAFTSVPRLDSVKQRITDLVKLPSLVGEGNYYYDAEKCGIGFHGDTERKIVIALRLGEPIPLHYQWYLQRQAIGTKIELILGHGDLYIMSSKAVGFDWKKRNIPTLRHAAGADKYLRIKTN